MDNSVNLRIINQLKEKYNLGPIFGLTYLKNWFSPEQIADFDLYNQKLNPPLSFWIEFALSTNLRGEMFYKELCPFLPENGKSFLDVGCGYGGSLVAFHNHGYQVTGLDINSDLVRLTQLNLSDLEINRPVILADILNSEIVGELGRFDVIGLYDVIEHVNDVPKCLDHLVDLLNPGGIIGFKIPNKDSIKYVANDGHFNLFGITLLPHPLANVYHDVFFHTGYDVGEYYPLRYYQDELKKRGCRSQVILRNLYVPTYSAPVFLALLLKRYLTFRQRVSHNLPKEISVQIMKGLRQYLVRFFRAMGNPFNLAEFQQHYLADVWTVIAVKNG